VVAALEQLTKSAAEPAKPAVQESAADTPELVRSAQKELRRIGCYAGRESGSLDDSTKRAVADYRSKRGQTTAEIKITEGLVAELKQQGSIESCIATPETPKSQPVARGKEKSKPEKSKSESARRHEKSKATEKREARPARHEAQPRARAEAAAPPRQAPRGGGGTMTGVGF
jgi:hypothetical protein